MQSQYQQQMRLFGRRLGILMDTGPNPQQIKRGVPTLRILVDRLVGGNRSFSASFSK